MPHPSWCDAQHLRDVNTAGDATQDGGGEHFLYQGGIAAAGQTASRGPGMPQNGEPAGEGIQKWLDTNSKSLQQ